MTAELPPVFQRHSDMWEQQLELLAEPLRETFDGLLKKLWLLIGPMAGAPVTGMEEPDGFEGLSKKGLVEHLLLSEWVLADELPDEFLRRAAMSEQLYLERRRLAEQKGRRCVVLLDVGPLQAGEPKVVQLAALLLLVERARMAGAEFAWGVLHRMELHDVDLQNIETSVRSLVPQVLGSRADSLPNINAWHEVLDDDVSDETDRELWLIGDAQWNDTKPFPSACYLSLEQVFTPENQYSGRDIEATLAQRTVHLPVPNDTACVRILRNPLATAKPQAVGVSSISGMGEMSISPCGRRLLIEQAVAGHDDCLAVCSYAIPNSPNQAMSVPRYFPSSPRKLVGYGWAKTACHAYVEGDQITVMYRDQYLTEPLPPDMALDKGQMQMIVAEKDDLRIFLLDGGGLLWDFDEEGLVILREGVVHAQMLDGGVAILHSNGVVEHCEYTCMDFDDVDTHDLRLIGRQLQIDQAYFITKTWGEWGQLVALIDAQWHHFDLSDKRHEVGAEADPLCSRQSWSVAEGVDVIGANESGLVLFDPQTNMIVFRSDSDTNGAVNVKFAAYHDKRDVLVCQSSVNDEVEIISEGRTVGRLRAAQVSDA